MIGGLIVVLTFGFSVVPAIRLEFHSQVLFTVVGFCMLLVSAGLFTLQNIHSFRIETRNRDFALKSLELQYEQKKTVIEQPPVQSGGSYTPPRGN